MKQYLKKDLQELKVILLKKYQSVLQWAQVLILIWTPLVHKNEKRTKRNIY